nr:glycosyltransferase family A protein [Micromonospora sp. DSM 115978]
MLVRRGGDPLGFVTVGVTDGRIDAREFERAATQLVALAAVGEQPVAPPSSLAPSGSPVAVTVVVCTRDRAQRLRDCLESLAECQYPLLDVVVVDNAASDDSTRLAFDAVVGLDQRFRYVAEPRAGLSRARNRGLAEATGDVVAFTDDDVKVDSRWVDGLARGFGRRADVGCVTGLVVARELDGPLQAYFDAKVSWSTSCEPRVFDVRPTVDRPATLYPV